MPGFSNRRNNRRAVPRLCPLEDRLTPTVSLVSANLAGTDAGNGPSFVSGISADGRFVVFTSQATNLTSDPKRGDVNDIFVRDTMLNTTEMVSIKLDGSGGFTGSGGLQALGQITPNGQYVLFLGSSNGFVTGVTSGNVLYRRDLNANTTVAASVGTGGVAVDVTDPFDISDDGRYVVFATDRAGVVAGDTNNTFDIFVRDLTTNTTKLVSHTTGGGVGNTRSFNPVISGNGKTILFESEATNLLSGVSDTNNAPDLFAYDVATDTVKLVTISTSGTTATGAGSYNLAPSIDESGNLVAFRSNGTDLVADAGIDPTQAPFQAELQQFPVMAISAWNGCF